MKLETLPFVQSRITTCIAVSVSKLANTIKTVTSREIRKRFALMLKPYYWKPVFWKRGYCAVSGGGATLEVIKSYIQSQGQDD